MSFDEMFTAVFAEDTHENYRRAAAEIHGNSVVASICRDLAIDLRSVSANERQRIERAIKAAYWSGASDGVSIRKEMEQ